MNSVFLAMNSAIASADHRLAEAPQGWLSLPQLGLIRAVGPEARSFLQNQFSNDAAQITATQGQLSGYCSAKGRLLAVLLVTMPASECFHLTLPAALVAPTLKRLKMFVLRSKLLLEDASAELPALGLMGAGANAALQELRLPAPSAAYATATQDGLTVQRLAGTLPRYLLRGSVPAPVQQELAWPQVSMAAWQAAEVRAAAPWVLPETVEHFVPQTIDLDLAGGVSFTKGCYPGQEIVARVHYLGRLKSRLHQATAAMAVAPGTAVYAAHGDGQAVGEVLLCAELADANPVLLTLNLSLGGSAQLRLGTVDGPALSPPTLAHAQT